MTENATNKDIADAIERGINKAQVAGEPLWKGATEEVIVTLTEKGDCYTSGKIASYLRTFRPDLRFAVSDSVGSYIRSAFYNGQLPVYDVNGNLTSPEMVPRVTQGFTRTPVGTEVFVYGPTVQLCTDDAFEVDIPQPGIVTPPDPQDANGLPAKPVQPIVPLQIVKAPVVRQPSTAQFEAHVHVDNRLCIRRDAIEELLKATGASLNMNMSLHIYVDVAKAGICLDPVGGTTPYKLSMTRGRVLFAHPTLTFTPNDKYSVTVDAANRRLIVDLTNKL